MKRIALFILLAAGEASASITPSATSNRTSGPPPLSVFFDATGTTESDGTVIPWSDIQYQWNFGDALGFWAISEVSKTTALGPLAGHVFEPSSYPDNCGAGANTCKQYTVTLRASGQNGSAQATPITINVTSPEVTWASTTVCVSSTSDFTGCPTVGSHVTDTGNWQTVLGNQITAGARRVLFHSGQSWTETAGYTITATGPGMIGTFDADGVCSSTNPCSARAQVSYTPTSNYALVLNADDWRVSDLDFQGPGSGSVSAVRFEPTLNEAGVDYNILNTAIRNNVQGFAFGFVTIGPLPTDGIELDQVAVVENTYSSGVSISGANAAYLFLNHSMILGNNFDKGGGDEHVLRVGHGDDTIISHNLLSSPAPAKHHLKLQSLVGFPSAYIVVSNNKMQGGSNPWMVGIGPTADTEDELVENVLFERNYLVAGTSVDNAVQVWARNVTVRSNIFDMSLATGGQAIDVSLRGTNPSAGVTNNEIYNNTCYSASVSVTRRCVQVASSASSTLVYNNLLYAPGTGTRAVLTDLGTGTVSATNTDQSAGANPFVDTSTLPVGLRLTVGNALLDSGTVVDKALYGDFVGVPVPQGSGPSRGAFESPLPGNILGVTLRGASVR